MGGNSTKEFFCCSHNNSVKNVDINIKNKVESEHLSKIQATFRGYLFRKKITVYYQILILIIHLH